MPHFKFHLVSYLVCFIAMWLTHLLQKVKIHNREIGKIKSSCLVTIFLGLILNFFAKKLTNFDLAHMELLILGSTFVGMADLKTFSFLLLTICGLLFYFSYEFLSIYFSGPSVLGGILGFFAFVSSLITFTIKSYLSRHSLD